ncbi:MAG: hypothetical protein Q9190_006233 [Brigantiaea leucoxantha]
MNERDGSDDDDETTRPRKETANEGFQTLERSNKLDEQQAQHRLSSDLISNPLASSSTDTTGTDAGGKAKWTPNLSIDTSEAIQGRSQEAGSSHNKSPLSGSPSIVPDLRSPKHSLRFSPSPISPRSRDRSFSLRKQLFTRHFHGESEGSASVTEVDPVRHGISSIQADMPTLPKKSSTTITISPVVEDLRAAELPVTSLKSSHRPLALPHYETWLRGRVARSGLISRLKGFHHKIHQKILQIQELPPSKNGRQLTLGVCNNKPQIDERTNREYVDNTIRSCKYTLWNFLPRQLYAQFSKLANFYFLCVSILQLIPGLSTTGTYTTIGPLAFFVTISMAKEGYDDVRRYKLDKAENNKIASVLPDHFSNQASENKDNHLAAGTSNPNDWSQTKWNKVRVGHVVRLVRDEAAPADLVILQAKGPGGIAYVETMALDGETNLKSKQASPSLAGACGSLHGTLQCGAHIVVEDPNLDLYNFEGKVNVANETLPLTNNNIIYRGSIIRNTPEVWGVVIYTGEECKIRMNATKNPRIKAPALQAVVNKVVIIIVLFVLALAIFNTVAYQIWQETTEEKSWYLVDASVGFFPILTSFIILFNTMIPLSLYVSLEIVKLFQLLLMNDVEMYDEDSNTPMEARTSTINEELGQVK